MIQPTLVLQKAVEWGCNDADLPPERPGGAAAQVCFAPHVRGTGLRPCPIGWCISPDSALRPRALRLSTSRALPSPPSHLPCAVPYPPPPPCARSAFPTSLRWKEPALPPPSRGSIAAPRRGQTLSSARHDLMSIAHQPGTITIQNGRHDSSRWSALNLSPSQPRPLA